jgi:hypothetical protein
MASEPVKKVGAEFRVGVRAKFKAFCGHGGFAPNAFFGTYIKQEPTRSAL